MKKKIPKFNSEAEERVFWQQNDSSEYLDWSDAEEVVFSQLKPSTRTISIRLPESMIEELKLLANKRDVPYQSLLKIFLSERIDAELHQYRTTSESCFSANAKSHGNSGSTILIS
ncbi:BrnA antitoxin family protein [Desulfonema magnum]|uniref:Toxin-antitoxin system, antitoxin component, CopG-like n=1 Tax=Desulfonema magnum TaxID=45655 RepID=A0A975BYD1_9BACT|nr:BrnA antitoxin family protein [Desulfonema magnum]QTA93415.1 Toxin-antitoxin system, antitoxin component, CopG-like [Desulfonema magnum]